MILTEILNSKINARKQIELAGPIERQPIISIVMPVFDQESVIFKHLDAICKCMSMPFELILINDASTDKTDQEIKRFLKSFDLAAGNCARVKYFKTLWPWFETRCDDFAIREAVGSHVLEIQADMLIKEIGFDKKMFDLMQNDQSLFALSARGTHGLDSLVSLLTQQKGTDISDKLIRNKFIKKVYFKILKEIRSVLKVQNETTIAKHQQVSLEKMEIKTLEQKIFPSNKDFALIGSAGFLGELVDLLPYETTSEINAMIEKNSKMIWFGETVMRGPIMIDKRIYIASGGFNIGAFYQGNDDHDLMLRVRHSDKKVGFTPIYFSSPLNLGNARKKRKIKSKIWSKLHRKIRMKAYKNSELLKHSNKK
jgi:glycosyltransferase involved in cell wall biosynthesis